MWLTRGKIVTNVTWTNIDLKSSTGNRFEENKTHKHSFDKYLLHTDIVQIQNKFYNQTSLYPKMNVIHVYYAYGPLCDIYTYMHHIIMENVSNLYSKTRSVNRWPHIKLSKPYLDINTIICLILIN